MVRSWLAAVLAALTIPILGQVRYAPATALRGSASSGPPVHLAGTAAQAIVGTGSFPLMTWDVNWTMIDPAVAPTTSATSLVGACTSAETYRFYAEFQNQSGRTRLSPASGDVVPGSTNHKVPVNEPTTPSNALSWKALYSKASESHATKRYCSDTPAAVATTTINCLCNGATVSSDTNTSGSFIVASLRDGQVRMASFSPGNDKAGLVDNRRLIFDQSYPRWTADAGTTVQPVLLSSARTKYVCAAGCEFSDIGSAIDSITDASSTNRYAVIVHPGQYAIAPTLKSYVYLIGLERHSVRLTGGLFINGAAVETGAMNMTILGSAAIQFLDVAGAQTILLRNLDIGGFDASEAAVTIDCLISKTSGGVTFLTSDLRLRSTSDSIVPKVNDVWWGSGNTHEINTQGLGNPSHAWRLANPGVQIYEVASTIRMIADVNSEQSAFWIKDTVGTPTQQTRLKLEGSYIEVRSTNSGRTADTNCFWLDNTVTNSSGAEIDVSGTSCDIRSSASTGTLNGVKVTADANHSNWKFLWTGGKLALSGGATRNDVNNAETVSGFVLGLGDINHSGVYAGAGVVTPLGMTINADLVVGACALGAIAIDTGGAAREFCVCGTTNTWGCWKLTDGTFNAAGPAD